jgi:serine phosphatase RsbU (regulator of sigma subunit)
MQGQRFTRWKLADEMWQPWFYWKGLPVKLSDVLSLFLLCSIVNAVYRYSVEQARQQRALLEEYRSAQELQRMLIPEALPALPGYAVTSAYRPAAEVGGDFFQLIPLDEGSTLVVVGDVSGKGLKAAMTVSLIVGALRTVAEISDDPGAILAGLNRRLHGRLANGFVTCLVLRISPSGECLIANAGHLAPFLNDREVSVAAALPLGIVDDERYESAAIHLDVDDRLTLYTDGLLEARNAAGELFSFERLSQLMAAHPDAGQAVETAVAFGQEDDVTVVTLTRLATGVESTTSLFAPELAPLLA